MTKSTVFTFESAMRDTLKYFNGDELAASVFLDKYALKNNDEELLENTPEMMHRRLAREFARIDKCKFKQPFTEQQIFDLFDHFKYIIPQGSPMTGIGNDYQIVSLSNCYVIEPPIDSYSSIMKTDEQLINISKRRGGVGINLSNLRPTGTPTRNAARSSTGISTWMERYSNSIREVGQSGRRGALMLILDIRHPDIETFITIKNDDTKVTGANISVQINRDFMDAVKRDADFQLQWPVDSKKPKIVKTVKAKELWNLLIKSAHNRAEPGILMWDNFMENGPADQYPTYRSVATNPCAEISLCAFDSCRLMALNLYSYVKNPFTPQAEFDFELFGKNVFIAQRLMDDLVDLECEKVKKILAKIDSDPEPEEIKRDERHLWERIFWYNNNGRRTGLGITGLGDALAAIGVEYASKSGVETTEKIYRALKLSAYRSSVEMAKELGMFTGYDPKVEEKCPFIQRIAKEDPVLYEDMKLHGRRNVALLTTAPTGTVSILTQTTSGIEPLFQLGYKRRKKVNVEDKNARVDFVDQSGDSWQDYTVYHSKVKVWMDVTGNNKIEESPWFNCTAEKIDWKQRIETQAAAQRHVCHSISSTINLPSNVTVEEVGEIYRSAFEAGCKGVTIYRDGCRTGVLVKEGEKKAPDAGTASIVKTTAPKRPKELPCDIYHVKVSKKLDKLRVFDFMVLIGLYNNEPYEVFAVENGKYDKKLTKGSIIRESEGKYRLRFEDGSELGNITENTTESEDALTRMTSTALRHGADVHFVAEQLNKVNGVDLLGFAKAISRALKRYIKDNTVSKNVCSICGGKLIYESGCCVCKGCGFSAC